MWEPEGSIEFLGRVYILSGGQGHRTQREAEDDAFMKKGTSTLAEVRKMGPPKNGLWFVYVTDVTE